MRYIIYFIFFGALFDDLIHEQSLLNNTKSYEIHLKKPIF